MRRSRTLLAVVPAAALALTGCGIGSNFADDLEGQWSCQGAGGGGLRTNLFDSELDTHNSSFDIGFERIGKSFRYTLVDEAGYMGEATYTGYIGYTDEGEFYINDNTMGNDYVLNLPDSLSDIEGDSQAIQWKSNGFQVVLEHPGENEVVLRSDAPEGAMRCLKESA
ncbi:hypothetical protein AVL61_04960 [Kocuria rosea subsp. polaris]|uniref:Lipoprotein n=1 Tax=Kocuria rosea subsp. polaris TaxID=136273 RepID=A0A0W8I8J4_KOCRO|nr:hypothetical protein [Kocuria polaris]KUG55485.1 hypothetical protein AVL61_04960 [Kocuria polaris]